MIIVEYQVILRRVKGEVKINSLSAAYYTAAGGICRRDICRRRSSNRRGWRLLDTGSGQRRGLGRQFNRDPVLQHGLQLRMRSVYWAMHPVRTVRPVPN